MKKPSFTINRTARLITIQLNGDWNSSIDLEYLSELANTMNQMRQGTWAIVADLRNWYIDADTAQQNSNYSLQLDRRNQIAEAWLLRDPEQAMHLDDYFDALNFSPVRVTELDKLQAWASEHNIELPIDLLSKPVN